MKSVLITGCSSGIGRILVRHFLDDGWKVMATLRTVESANSEFEAELHRYPRLLFIVPLDVTNAGQRAQVAAKVEQEFSGSLNCLINNAGFGLFGALEDLSEDQIRAQFEVNFFGACFLTRIMLPYLRAPRGRVINLSSVFGITGMPLTSAYCASKFALEGLTEALHHELAPHGVQVTCVEPGSHRTRFGPNSVWAQTEANTHSPYALQTANYVAFREKLMTRKKGRSGEAVALAILKLANARTLPLRIAAGPDARVTLVLSKWLPTWLWLKITGAIFRKIFMKRAKN